ncbi:MAG TPA: radical SAM protein [Myxococcota bacterium]|nr:radical SAM protein [Myxococcota bacterium]
MRPTGKRVMLVAPPGRCTTGGSFHAVPPEGVARLSAWLRKHGFEVAALDTLIEGYDLRLVEGKTVRYGITADQAAAMIAEWSPDVIGFSCPFTCTEADVIQIARACRSLLPDAWIVLGGAHAAANAAALLKNEPVVDLVALSEGEQALASLVSSIRGGGNPTEVDGFASRKGDGSIQKRPLKQFLDLDRLPLPAWDLFPIAAYAKANSPHFGMGQGRRYLPTTWSRGCVNACSYCLTPRFWGRGNYRKRSIARILDEARSLHEKFEIEELHVEDDCLLANKAWFHAILESMAQENPGLRLDFPNGLDVTDLDGLTADKLARAGTIRAGLAFDAGEPAKPLKWVGKQIPLKQGREAVNMLHAGGITLIGYFMLGFPGQTIDDMRATVDYALSLDLDALSLFIATPFPQTPLHTYCERAGLLVRPYDYEDFRFSSGHIRTSEFGPADTERLRHEGWLKFQNRRRDL